MCPDFDFFTPSFSLRAYTLAGVVCSWRPPGTVALRSKGRTPEMNSYLLEASPTLSAAGRAGVKGGACWWLRRQKLKAAPEAPRSQAERHTNANQEGVPGFWLGSPKYIYLNLQLQPTHARPRGEQGGGETGGAGMATLGRSSASAGRRNIYLPSFSDANLQPKYECYC